MFKYLKDKISGSEPSKADKDVMSKDYRSSLLGWLPMWSRLSSTNSLKHTRNINRYLYFQGKRIEKLIEQDKSRGNNQNRAVLLWLILMKNSKSYQLVLFNRVIPNWYWKYSRKDALNILKLCCNRLRQQNLWLELTRTYLVKPNGKLRPIGSPDFPSRVVARGLSDLIYAIYGNKIGSYQHGYLKNKGIHTAVFDIIERLKKKPKIVFEFDLTAFFNRVSPFWVYKALLDESELLADYVSKVIHQIKYSFKELKSEEELKLEGHIKFEGRLEPKIIRKGLPQGLAISPILSMLALNKIKTSFSNIIMYADDGIFIGDKIKDFKKWREMIGLIGTDINEKKSGYVQEEFKFLGVIINTTLQTVSYENRSKSWYDPNLLEWLSQIMSKYSEKNNRWHWDVHYGSYISGIKQNTWKWSDLAQIMYSSYRGKMYRGYRYFNSWSGIVDVMGSSSICVNQLAEDLKSLELKKVKSLRPHLESSFKNLMTFKTSKGTAYWEEMYEANVDGWMKENWPEFGDVRAEVQNELEERETFNRRHRLKERFLKDE